MTTTAAQKRATLAHRHKMRRVELLLDPRAAESRALDRLILQEGTTAAAVRYALLKAVPAMWLGET